jgi:hypothetical protein
MKKLLLIVPLVILLAAACGNSRQTAVQTQPVVSPNVQPTPALPSFPQNPPHSAPMKKVSTNNWKTYTNVEYGLSFQYPASWKLAEYKSSSGPGQHIVAIALDPVKVGTQKDFESVDTSMGTVEIFFGQGQPIGYDSFANTTLGPGKIAAKYSIGIYGADAPNPAWSNKTSESYYFYLLEKFQTKDVSSVELRFAYPNSKTQDTNLQNILQTITSTFSFAS